ncbi:MAG: DNA recombination protein RmuC, partial [Sphaerochaetaceae bacterium]|nr:DNA recombination protein RmuC [Sphaerochaetaceae bacterium]
RILDSSNSLLFSVLIVVAVSLSSYIVVTIAIRRLEKNMRSAVDEQLNKNIQTLTNIAQLTQNQLHQINETIDIKLTTLRTDNERKLEQIRHTVDEQLQQTLERRLGESFKLVSEQLTTVNKSLGEMRNLADGVGDLKRVLSNVKARGIWGEFQLHAILKEMLTSEQYDTNVATRKGSNERVEFVIKLPGSTPKTHVLLPIDAKFPKEDYERLIDAQRNNEIDQIDSIRKAIRLRIRGEAKDISSKYINVPVTTDFAILFLPLEGLYAEVLQHPGFVEELQTKYRVTIAGPTTLMALLNSLQMGFRTLSIQEHSSEVWQILSKVKSEFVQFGVLLDKTKKRLDLASTDLSLASKRSEKIQRTLVSVETNGAEAHEEIEENTK